MTTAKSRLSIKQQTIYTIAAICAAVAFPQIFHVMGAVSGLGTSLGETMLPMQLPILLVGFLAGPYAGAISGLAAPLVSFAFSGMPTTALLPFMMLELCAYGFICGIMRNSKIPAFAKVVVAQIFGRVIRAIAICFATYILGFSVVPVSIIWTSIAAGIFGIVLQWALIPLILHRVESK